MANNALENTVTSSSSQSLIGAARSHIITGIRDLNLFSDNPFWSSILTFREKIQSTRLFLLLTTISLVIVIIYSSLIIQNHEITLNKFTITDFERLASLYPSTINAPCSEVSVAYHKFLYFSPEFHQVCKSPFIQKKWIASLFIANATSHNILDFRTFAFAHFRSLGLLCRISQHAVKDMHYICNSTHLIHRNIFSRNEFNEIISVLAHNLQQTKLNNEKRTGNVISMIIAQNRLFSALRTNYYIQSIPGSRAYTTYYGVYLERNQSECDCRLKENQCIYPAGAFYNWTIPDLGMAAKNDPPPRFQIPGLMAGCLPLDAMRQSTLECLYDQSCINSISLRPELSQPKALNASLSRFSSNLTIGSMFDESLFVESWNNKSSFEDYFAACAPRTLSYSYKSRFHLGTVLTISLSAFGGLVMVWELITPAIVKVWRLIRKQRKPITTTEDLAMQLAVVQMAPKPINKVVTAHVHRIIHNFNLFPSTNKTDENEERIGIITTRLYLFLTLMGLIILGFYTCLSKHNQTYTISWPSLDRFEQLHSMNLSTLNCPCSRLSMSYNRFMSLAPRYHSICSSDYLQHHWLSYFGRVEIDLDSINFLTTDFRINGQALFELTKILCRTANKTIENALDVFKSTRLFTLDTLSRTQFSIETNTRLNEFKQGTISSFIDLIEMIRSLIQTNQLAEELWTNVGPLSSYNNETSKWSFTFRPRDFYRNSCSCAVSNQCIRSVGFLFQNNTIRDQPIVPVPGLVLGCYAIDSLLSSTYECFYNRNCIKLLLDHYDFDVVDLVRPLNDQALRIQPLESKNTRFPPDTKINEIFSQLFVENWIDSSNYTAYYVRCAPSQCTYTIPRRFNIAYVFTIMLGFYGGLAAFLQIILPILVKWIMQRPSNRNETNNLKTDTTTDVCPSSSGSPPHSRGIFNSIISLNFFSNESSSTDEKLKKNEIIATRIYIVLLVLCLSIALLYYGPFHSESKFITIKSPELEIVHNLHQKNISTLSCPCSTVAIRYSNILSLTPKYHPICSNESILLNFRESPDNLSLALYTHYRLLFTLCNLSNHFISNAVKVFGTRELITIDALESSSFNIEVNALISTFISDISSEYRRTLSFIVGSFNVNQILHLFTSNWKMKFTDQNEKNIIHTYPRKFSNSNCTCAVSSNCKELLIDEIFVGCFPYDGFRLSKFQNISLEFLNQQLFVEIWTNQSNYTNYFQTCKPLQCQYTIPDRNNPILILTTLLGLYGGLTYVLNLIVRQSLLASQWWRKNQQRKLIQTATSNNPVSI